MEGGIRKLRVQGNIVTSPTYSLEYLNESIRDAGPLHTPFERLVREEARTPMNAGLFLLLTRLRLGGGMT